MKKLISLLLAVSVMVASTCASAAYLGCNDSQRNIGSWGYDFDGDGNNEAPVGENVANSNTFRDYFRADQMACYRPGDVLRFTDGDQTVKAGDVVTFICSKRGATELDNSTVMFIDQKVAEGDSFIYDYKLRTGLAEGGYVINIKIGDADVKSFYFSVGDPKVEMLTVGEGGADYLLQDGVAYYFAAATIGSADVRFEQVAERFGFDSANLEATTFDAGAYDVYAASQEGDAATFIFTIGLDGFEDVSELPAEVNAYINE